MSWKDYLGYLEVSHKGKNDYRIVFFPSDPKKRIALGCADSMREAMWYRHHIATLLDGIVKENQMGGRHAKI